MRLLATLSVLALVMPVASASAQPRPGMPQAAPGMPTAHQPNENDRLFVRAATIGGNTEVQFGQLAEQKGRSPAVKDFARQMVTDHSQANQRLMQLAQTAGLPQPNELDEEHKAMRAEFDRLDGAAFDLAYIRGQVADHQQTAQLFEWEIGSGQDPELKAFASEVLPVVLRHLQMAQGVEYQLTATAAAPNPPPGGGAPPPAGRPPAR